MAWLEKKGAAFRIRFRFGGAKHLCALHTSDRTEAEDSLARFEANLRLVDRGIIDPPPGNVDLGVYILSGGKLTTRPAGGCPGREADTEDTPRRLPRFVPEGGEGGEHLAHGGDPHRPPAAVDRCEPALGRGDAEDRPGVRQRPHP